MKMNDSKTPFPPGHFDVNVAFDPNNKLGEYREFIGIYPNMLDINLCNEIIDIFNQKDSHWHEDTQFNNKSLGRYDTAADLSELRYLDNRDEILKDALFTCLSEYKSIFTCVDMPLYFTSMKMQCTPPGGGYHVWHAENTNFSHCSRMLTWMVYLNDIADGGETEFLYQGQRISPQAGTILIWPASYTHPHRGNPPLKENKYIVTGWFLITP